MKKYLNKKIIVPIFYAVLISILFFAPQIAQASCSASGGAFCSPICEGGICNSYDDFIAGLWVWALRLAIPLSILVIAAAGVVWTTSEGNPDRIGLAKKLIWGVVSGLGLLLLARVLLVDIIGIDASLWKN